MTTADSISQIQRFANVFVVLLSLALGALVLFHLFVVGMLSFFHDGGAWHAALSFSATGTNLSVFSGVDHTNTVLIEALRWPQRAILSLISIACAIGNGLVLFHLRQLFALYSRGVIFSQNNIYHIKRFGLWLVIGAIVINISGRMFQMITGHAPQEIANSLMAFLYGGMTYVIARVMELGREADQERKEFI